MKIKITIGRILLTLLIIGLIYNLYYFHTHNLSKTTFINIACSIIGFCTYVILGLFLIFIIKDIDWDKIFSKGFTIDLNRWKNKNNN